MNGWCRLRAEASSRNVWVIEHPDIAVESYDNLVWAVTHHDSAAAGQTLAYLNDLAGDRPRLRIV